MRVLRPISFGLRGMPCTDVCLQRCALTTLLSGVTWVHRAQEVDAALQDLRATQDGALRRLPAYVTDIVSQAEGTFSVRHIPRTPLFPPEEPPHGSRSIHELGNIGGTAEQPQRQGMVPACSVF